MDTTLIAVIVLAVVAVGTLVLLVVNAQRKRRLRDEIPPALQPGYSDAQLEGPVLDRYLGWGLVLVLFFAVFLPAYWLREPARINERTQQAFAADVSAGEELFEANCAECHGADGGGGAALSPYGNEPWPAPNLRTIAQRYAESQVVTDVRDHIVTTIERGRPGTPMPAWGAAFGGPMTDSQIQQITDWILSHQEDVVAEAQPAVDSSGEELYFGNCSRCHGGELQGVVGPTLVGVFERHSRETILGILRNGIYAVGNGYFMPPWQNGYEYEGARYTDEALLKIIDYLESQQPTELPGEAQQWQPPGVGEPLNTEEPAPPTDGGTDGADDEQATEEATEV